MPTTLGADALYPEGPKEELGNGVKTAGLKTTIMNWLFGESPKPSPEPSPEPTTKPLKQDPRKAGTPTAEEIAASKSADLAYGDPIAPHLAPGAKLREASASQIVAWSRSSSKEVAGAVRNATDAEKHQLHEQWLAARNSPVAMLGFKPEKMSQLDPKSGMVVVPIGNKAYEAAGEYRISTDTGWQNPEKKWAAVHESLHRGMTELQREMKLSRDPIKDEMTVRALMLRHLGPVEGQGEAQFKGVKEVEEYAQKHKSELDALEALAAQHLANKRPRGPR